MKPSKAAMKVADETFEPTSGAYDKLVLEMDRAMQPEREAAEKMAEALRFAFNKLNENAGNDKILDRIDVALAAYESSTKE